MEQRIVRNRSAMVEHKKRIEKRGGPKKGKYHELFKQMYRCRMLYLLILPAIISVFIFHYIPLYGVQIAFRDFRPSKGIWGSEWVGLKYFIKFVKYPYFFRIMRNTLWISLVSLVLTFPLPIAFAIMLNEMKSMKLRKVCQTITYAPYFVSTVVVCSMTIMFLSREGLVNMILGMFGVEAIDFMAKPSAFALIYAISGVWSTLGWGTIIYMATLAGVSMELVEAAKIDGAGRFKVIWHVYLPHLKPTIITLLILRLGTLLSVGFEKTFLLQNNLNMDASSVISTYTYELGLLNQQFSYSAAVGLFNNLVNVVMIVTANYVCRKLTDSSLW